MNVRHLLRRGGIFILPVIVFLVIYPLTEQVWQDYVLLFGTLLISVTLIPTLLDPRAAVPRMTSIPAAVAVALFVVATAGLGFWLTAAANLVSLVFWVLVVVYRAP